MNVYIPLVPHLALALTVPEFVLNLALALTLERYLTPVLSLALSFSYDIAKKVGKFVEEFENSMRKFMDKSLSFPSLPPAAHFLFSFN